MTRRPRAVSGTGRSGRGALAPLPTIVLVDADEDARAMLRDALLEGAQPSTLRTVSDAAGLAPYLVESASAPSLVLVDLELPGEDALDVVRTLKSGLPLRRIPVIVLTRGADPERIAAAYDAGANTVIPRPVTFLALVRLVKVFTAYWLDAAVLPEPA
jgi:chemotaxis family two-component system response regulator Rcp1